MVLVRMLHYFDTCLMYATVCYGCFDLVQEFIFQHLVFVCPFISTNYTHFAVHTFNTLWPIY